MEGVAGGVVRCLFCSQVALIWQMSQARYSFLELLYQERISPLLTPDNLVQRFTATQFERLVLRSGITKRNHTKEVCIFRDTKQCLCFIDLINRRDAGANPEFPGPQLHLCGCLPQVKTIPLMDCFPNQGHCKVRSSQMPGEIPGLGEFFKCCAVLNQNELPRLCILTALRTPPGFNNLVNDLVWHGLASKLTHSASAADDRPQRRLGGHGQQSRR